MTTDTKPHEFPRGRWHQIEQVEAVEKGIINTSEYFFLGMVDALCNWKKQGCWASDDYLAERMGLTSRQIRNIVFHLSGHDLIRDKKVYNKAIDPPMLYVGTKKSDGSRVLVTKWFLAECDGKLPGVRFNHLETNFQSSTSTEETNFQNPGNKFPNGFGNKFPQSNTRSDVLVTEDITEGVPPGKAGAASPPKQGGFFNETKQEKTSSKGSTAPDFCSVWEAQARKILVSKKPTVGKILGTRQEGIASLLSLWKQLGENEEARLRISIHLELLEKGINDDKLKDELPTLRRVKDFVRLYPDWIEPKLDWWVKQQELVDRKILYRVARKVAKEEGFVLARDGRLFENGDEIPEGQEINRDAPDAVMCYIRFVRGIINKEQVDDFLRKHKPKQ